MLKLIWILLFTLVSFFVVAQQDNKDELERKRRQTLQEIEVLNRQYNEIKKSKKVSLGQLAVIQRKIELRNQVINDINRQVRVIDVGINSSYREMRRLGKDLDTLRMRYAKNVVYAYKNRSSYDFLNFLFSATNFNDAIRRITYMRAYRNYRAQEMEAIVKTEKLYKGKIIELTSKKKEKSKVLEDQSKEMDELVKDKNEQNAVVNEFKKKEGEISKTLAAKRKQVVSLQNAIAVIVKRMITEEEEKRKLAMKKAAAESEEKKRLAAANNAKTNTKPTEKTGITEKPIAKAEPDDKPTKANVEAAYKELNKEELALEVNFENNRGKLPWPVDNGYVSTPFGTSTVGGLVWKQDWITITSAIGTPVKTVFDGEVVSVSDVNGVSTVAVKHGNYVTMYSNLKSVSVNKGQNVTRGTVIGRVDANLEGDGSIEFILLKGSQNLNPSSWLRNR